MFIFINPVRHKTSLMLKPILSQSRGSEWNVCSAGVLSVCSQLWWNKNQCAHTIGQKGRYWWVSHLFRRLFLSAWRTMQPIGFKQIHIVIAISTCVVDGSFDLSTDIVLWDWSNAFISPAPITYQGNRIWDRGRKGRGGGGWASEGMKTNPPCSLGLPQQVRFTVKYNRKTRLNIVHSTMTRTSRSQLSALLNCTITNIL